MILSKNTPPIKILSLFFILSLIYAILRYHIFGGVSWDQLPLYVMNKVLALTVVLLLSYHIWFLIIAGFTLYLFPQVLRYEEALKLLHFSLFRKDLEIQKTL